MNNFPLNPWLEEIIRRYQGSRSEVYMREWYKKSCLEDENLSWQDFLTRSYLLMHLHQEPFYRKSLVLLPFSPETKDLLYWTGVDSLYDLLQITKEELDVICADDERAKQEVIRYLAGLGIELKSFSGRTTKLSIAYGFWAIPSPGSSHVFNIARPTLRDEWFNEYYSLYGHFDKEDIRQQEFDTIQPIFLDSDRKPDDYREFFNAAENFFDAYGKCCAWLCIEPRVDKPKMPVRDVRFVYWEALRAVIDIFEQDCPLRNATAGEYLSSSDEGMLMIADLETHNEDFQTLLNSQVELKIDIENIGVTLDEFMAGHHKSQFFMIPGKVRPLNPWLAEQIEKFRSSKGDEELRRLYNVALTEEPELSWRGFLKRSALVAAVEADPALLERCEDMDIPDALKERLFNLELEILEDIVQLTREVLSVMSILTNDDKKIILDYAESKGYPLQSFEKNVSFCFLEDYGDYHRIHR